MRRSKLVVINQSEGGLTRPKGLWDRAGSNSSGGGVGVGVGVGGRTFALRPALWLGLLK